MKNKDNKYEHRKIVPHTVAGYVTSAFVAAFYFSVITLVSLVTEKIKK